MMLVSNRRGVQEHTRVLKQFGSESSLCARTGIARRHIGRRARPPAADRY